MEVVQDERDIYQNISAVKQGATQFLTNFYLTGFKLKELIDDKKLFMINKTNNVFFLRENDGFYNLYFCSGNKDYLDESLTKYLNNITLPIVSDLIGAEKSIKDVKDIFVKNNFNHHTTFFRFYRTNNDNDILYPTDDILFAKQEDAQGVYSIISSNFDKYIHHLPAFQEIEDLIKLNYVLIKKEGNKIVGLYIFDKTGLSSTSRYIYVDKNYRGQKIAAKLKKKYFMECEEIKRFILWVEESNIPVINMEEKHWGYNLDKLIDFIMIKGVE